MHPGEYSGMSMDSIATKYPDQYSDYKNDAFHYRFPRAESFHDVVLRLERILVELEREENDLLIVADANVLKTIYAYLTGKTQQEIPMINLPKRQLLCLVPHPYGVDETSYLA